MSLKFFILGWSSENLRCPDHEINLCQDNSLVPYPVSLIQMPNGTGKTTTLKLLRATLSGSAKNWNPDEILAFRNNGNPSFGQFIVHLALNEKRLTFELNLDFEKLTVDYRTTFRSGVKDGFYPPPQISKFLNPTFADLFVFDGELANHLLDANRTRAREAIDALFQLFLLEKVRGKFESYWQSYTETTNVKSEQWLTRLQNELKGLNQTRQNVKHKQTKLNKEKSRLKSQIEQAQAEYDKAFKKDENLGKDLDDLNGRLQTAENLVKEQIGTVMRSMRSPHKLLPGLAHQLVDLKSNLDLLKLPTSTSKEFFDELAAADECVCGRHLDDLTRQAIRDRAQQYLGEDEVGVLNSIKSDIADYCYDSNPDSYHQEFQQELNNLSKFIRDRDDLKTQKSGLENLREQKGDSEIREKKERLQELEEKQKKCIKDLEEIERSPSPQPDKNTECLKELNRLIQDKEYEVAEATNTIKLKKQIDILSRILNQAHGKAREELRELILKQTNDRIAELLSRDPIFLEDIQESLKLQGKEGASVGQTLSVSYAFLATLFNRTEHQLPFIVDSPAGPLDLNIRPEVARLIPKLCDQFVAFTISSERQNFVDVLEYSKPQNIKYLTIFRKTPQMNDLWQNIDDRLVTETSNGILIQGKEFFDRFDLDKEI
ncbi:hypothetical protein JJD41_14895 [Oxynema sp. CENA135]|nr:hypothetical protein [Oxynema sp. CENA135]